MARQANDAHVVSHVFATELSTQTDILSSFQKRLFKFDVAESAARFVTGRGKVVIEVRRSQLHREHCLFSRRSADHKGDVIRGAGSRTQALHLFNEVGNKCLRVQNGLGFLVEVALIGRTATLHYAQEVVFVAFNSFNVDLSGKVALGVLFFVHRQRSVLRVTQAVGRVGLENAQGESFFIAETSPNGLAFFAVNNGSAGILAEGQFTLGGHFSVAQEGKSDVLVVIRGFRILQNLGHLFIVSATEHKVRVVESLFGQKGQSFRLNFEDLMTFEFTFRHVVFGEKVIFRVVFTELEHRSVFKFNSLSHFSLSP